MIKNKIKSLDQLMECLSDEIKIDSEEYLYQYQKFTEPVVKKLSNKVDVFIFDVSLKNEIVINAREVKDYKIQAEETKKILDINIKKLLENKDLGYIYLFTNYEQKYLKNEKIVNILVNIDTDKLMYERVLCMASFVNSKLFQNPTCFVDTDAFVKIDLINLFEYSFDIALTHRDDGSKMPINEGVLFVNNQNKERIKLFFDEYTRNYRIISKSKAVKKYYGMNLDLWRGGQLSLNMIAYNNGSKFRDYELIKKKNFTLMMLPVYYYNFTPINNKNYTLKFLKLKKVLHFKGNLKKYLDKIKLMTQ